MQNIFIKSIIILLFGKTKNMKYLVVFLTWITIIGVILLANVRIVISRNINSNNHNLNIDLYLFPLFNYRIDIDEMFRKYASQKNNEIIKNTIKGINDIISSKKIIKDLCKKIVVDRVDIYISYNQEVLINPYITVFNWCILTLCEKLIIDNFKKVKSEDFDININSNNIDSKFLIDGNIKIGSILWVGILNLQQMIKIMKGRKKKYGTTSY